MFGKVKHFLCSRFAVFLELSKHIMFNNKKEHSFILLAHCKKGKNEHLSAYKIVKKVPYKK